MNDINKLKDILSRWQLWIKQGRLNLPLMWHHQLILLRKRNT